MAVRGPEEWALREAIMAQANAELFIVVETVLEDHADLRKMVTGLRGMCRALREGRCLPGPESAALIEEFESQLIPHFAAEQAEEYFGSLVTEQPRLLQRVERLQAEHAELAEALDRLIELARSEDGGPELGVRLGQFLDSFEAHEHAENRLMQEFLLLDEGTGD
jgi:signal transduction histidine kinase